MRTASGREFYKCGKELHEDDGYAALYSIYPGLRLLPSALLLAVTPCTASAGRPSCALEALGTRNTGAPGWEFATPLQADHDCGARGATFFGRLEQASMFELQIHQRHTQADGQLPTLRI